MEDRILSTDNQQRAQYFNSLSSAFGDFMKPRWYSPRPSVASIAEFCDLLARARMAMWGGVYSQFPDANDGGAWEVRDNRRLVKLEPKL